MKRVIEIGQYIRGITVLERLSGDKHGNAQYKVKCDCGKIFVKTRPNILKDSKVKSCGCYNPKAGVRIDESFKKKRESPLHSQWHNIKGNSKRFGFFVDPGWKKDFDKFSKDVGPRPSPTHQLYRINLDGGFVPGNVRWVTRTKLTSGAKNLFKMLALQPKLNDNTPCS